MHPENLGPSPYLPTSPLSPRMSTNSGHLSPQSARYRSTQSKPPSRKFHVDLPAYPTYFGQSSSAATPSSTVQSPALSLHRGPQPTPMEQQQKVMSRGQRNFLKELQLSSTLAASPMMARPGGPRLQPLGSPKGPVTPLALEQHEAADYFGVVGAGKYSPAVSPGGRSSRSDGSIKEESAKKLKQKKKTTQVDLYQ